ncbi:MAG: hypothetical protein ACPKPY_07005 [Nitrososphaeraceae archaeon]
MKIYYISTPKYEQIMYPDKDIFEGFQSEITGDLEYCCNDLKDHFWISLDDPEYLENDSPEVLKEPKVIFGYSHNMHGYTMLGMEIGFKFCPFCGTRFELKRIGDAKIEN